jgi:hypothetical protein
MTIVTRPSRPAQACKHSVDQKFSPAAVRQLYGPEHASAILERVLPRLLAAWERQ